MIRILSSQQIKAVDAYTIQQEPVASIDLMERACRAFVSWFTERFGISENIGIVCGTGNNGGDGLGIARLLKEWGYPIKVWIVRGSSETEDFKVNLQRIEGKIEVVELSSAIDDAIFNKCTVLIDAIFGSGLSRPVQGIFADVIKQINNTQAVRIAVDIPSGLMADSASQGGIVKADFTITFQIPKLAFFFPDNFSFVGEWCIVDIGLSKEFIKQTQTSHFYSTAKAVRKIIHPRGKFDHKGTYGHALLIAGSYGKVGAALLAAEAVLRAGVGLLTVHIPKCGYTILQSSVHEAMASIDEHEHIFTTIPLLEPYTAIGVGPGLGQDKQTVKAFRKVLEDFRKPVVIDADALNILSANRELLSLIPSGSILTPHPKEFERIAGKWSNSFERLEKQKTLARQLRSVIVLKGAFTSIASPDGNVYFNPTGNPGMATGGTGDVLTGILTGLLAQGYSSIDAAIAGVYLHGLSGDLAAREKGMISLIASDVITFLPPAFKKAIA
ncbi:MAG TPA: NAD(P)H-hydrate dehydratase [Ohtaekwangia sp.]|uniref:NAD(P)H-hydrate dehydratase n=1 Tax=Ohtaekwangia sp. TaxID=2066019 RepID=UPI002F94B42D